MGLVVAVALGLVIGEFSELSPWMAHKLIRWAARVRYPTRVEELSALIAERPGKLFKLVTASGFACAALTYRVTHRKTVPVRSMTSRFWIGLGSALVTGVLLIGEVLLAGAVANATVELSVVIILGAIAAFVTAAELLVSTRLPAGWATAVVSFALYLVTVVLELRPRGGHLLVLEGMAVAAGGSAACAIWLGNRLRFPVMAALSAVLGCGLLTLGLIWAWSANDVPAMLGLGFAFGFSAGVGVLLWRVLCGRRLSQPSPEEVPRTAT